MAPEQASSGRGFPYGDGGVLTELSEVQAKIKSGSHNKVTWAPLASFGRSRSGILAGNRVLGLSPGRKGEYVDIDTSVFMATRDRAAALAEVRPARLDYWAARGLILPSVNERLTPRRAIKLYSYMELLAVLIVAEMRRRGVSLQHIRAVVDRVRGRGVENPLTEIRYAVVGGRLYLQDADGNWEDGQVPGQGVVPQVLDLRPLQARIRASLDRPKQTVGVVERRRGTLGSQEVIAGTRIPVQTIRHFLDDGRSTAEILENYPLLTPEDVEAVRASSAA